MYVYNKFQVYAGCNCQHNTAGNHCDECAVGYTHRPWAVGNVTDANECQGETFIIVPP